ncbi:hypothetical protein LT493_27200 [Streptomyces tricolor]|nr:hypothetical protein [Streptomyces tricolor]
MPLDLSSRRPGSRCSAPGRWPPAGRRRRRPWRSHLGGCGSCATQAPPAAPGGRPAAPAGEPRPLIPGCAPASRRSAFEPPVRRAPLDARLGGAVRR